MVRFGKFDRYIEEKERRMWYLDTDAYELYCPHHAAFLWLLRTRYISAA